MTFPRVIADLASYDDLIAALSARAAHVGVSHSHLDELAGLSPGYTGKALGGSHTRKLGWLTTWLMLPALGLRVILVEDEKAIETMRGRYSERRANQSRPGNASSRASIHVINRVLRHLAPLGARARWRGTTKKQRSEHARHMATARWKQKRVERKARAVRCAELT